MRKEERQQFRDEARNKLEKFWNEQVQPLYESAAATFTSLYQAYAEKKRVFMQEFSARVGLDVDDAWVAYSPEGKRLGCYATEDREGQTDMPTGLGGMVKLSEWKYRQARFLPYDSKLSTLLQRGMKRLDGEHIEAMAREYEPYFARVREAWREIGADDYLVTRLSRLMTFQEAWDLILRRTSYKPMKESLDAFRKLHNIHPLSSREELEKAGVHVERVVEPKRNEEDLKRTSDALGIKSHVLEADVKEMAWLWEEATRKTDSPTPPFLWAVLGSVVEAYLRGRGFRMGNYQGVSRHIEKKTAIRRLVISCAAENEIFHSLHKAGVTSLDGFRDAIIHSMAVTEYDILDEVKQFLGDEEGGTGPEGGER